MRIREREGEHTRVRNSLFEECEIYVCSQIAFSGLIEHVYELVIFESLGNSGQPISWNVVDKPNYPERISV